MASEVLEPHVHELVVVGVNERLAVATATAAGLAGQAIEGRVVLDGWEEPVAYARVDLFDEGMATVAATTAGEDGSFAFPAVEPGTYYLQAQHGGLFGPVSAAVELAQADYAERVVLTLPSPLLDLARRCFTGALSGAKGSRPERREGSEDPPQGGPQLNPRPIRSAKRRRPNCIAPRLPRTKSSSGTTARGRRSSCATTRSTA